MIGERGEGWTVGCNTADRPYTYSSIFSTIRAVLGVPASSVILLEVYPGPGLVEGEAGPRMSLHGRKPLFRAAPLPWFAGAVAAKSSKISTKGRLVRCKSGIFVGSPKDDVCGMAVWSKSRHGHIGNSGICKSYLDN